jgi:hypothetical protein
MTLIFNDNQHCGIGFGIRRWCLSLGCVVVIVGAIGHSLGWAEELASQRASGGSILIEDFRSPDERGFPQGWGAQRSVVTAHETYMIQEEEGVSFLRAKKANGILRHIRYWCGAGGFRRFQRARNLSRQFTLR